MMKGRENPDGPHNPTGLPLLRPKEESLRLEKI